MAVSFLIAWLLLFLTGCGHGQGEASLGDSLPPGYLVSVTAGETTGSGILYREDDACLYVLTAAHVLSGSESGEEAVIRFFDGVELSCGDIRFSETSDLAVVQIPVDKIPAKGAALYQCVEWDKESFDGLRGGDCCTAMGFAADSKCIQYEGTVLEPWIYMEDYDQYMIWANVSIQPGMSGGGLLDEEGRLIGILSGGSEDQELAAVPLSLILQFMTDLDR